MSLIEDVTEWIYDLPMILKFGISIVWDFLDFTVFRIPGLGTFTDIIGGFIGLALWGKAGIIDFGEVFEPTDQIDGFIPALTISGVLNYFFMD